MKKVLENKEILTGYGVFVLAIASFGGLLFGYHIAVISGALVFLSPYFHLSAYQEGIVVSIMLLGALIGALIAGYLTDRFGRKKTMILMSLLFILSAIVIGVTDSYYELLIGRVISGLALGIVSVAAPLYLAEIAPPHQRGSCVSIFQLAIAFGILFAFGMAFIFAEDQRWRALFLVGGMAAFLQLLGIFLIPETPTWSASHQKFEQGKQALQKLRRDQLWKSTFHSLKMPKEKGEWRLLFKPHLRAILIVGLMLSIFQQITGINAIIFYTPKIFQLVGITSNTGSFLATLSVGGINFFATLFSVFVLDKVGRRRLLLVGSVGMMLSLSILSFAFFIQSQIIDQLALISLLLYTCCFAFSFGPVTWVILSEIFPLKIRGNAIALALGVNWLANYVISLMFPDLIHRFGGGTAFALLVAICFCSLLFIYKFIPETKGKSLEEIESMVNSGKF